MNETPRRPKRRGSGQALVEAALVLPVLFLAFLGMAEAGMAFATNFDQQRLTATLADYLVQNDGVEDATTDVLLTDCTEKTLTTEWVSTNVLSVSLTCHYTPQISSNIWSGLDFTTATTATLVTAVVPSPSPTPSPCPTGIRIPDLVGLRDNLTSTGEAATTWQAAGGAYASYNRRTVGSYPPTYTVLAQTPTAGSCGTSVLVDITQ